MKHPKIVPYDDRHRLAAAPTSPLDRAGYITAQPGPSAPDQKTKGANR